MKKVLFLSSILSVALALYSFEIQDENAVLEIGEIAPLQDNKMVSVNDLELSLADLKRNNGLLVIFSSNSCPFVIGEEGRGQGWEGRYRELQATAKGMGIGMVLVNSNEAKRDGSESMEEMKRRAKELNYTCQYVLDKNHQLADAFGARTTPHVFLFNKEMKLVYKGAIDDNYEKASEVKEHWLQNAMKNLAAGKTIAPNSTRQLGCSIKRIQ
jgi:thioredoxin-related protein